MALSDVTSGAMKNAVTPIPLSAALFARDHPAHATYQIQRIAVLFWNQVNMARRNGPAFGIGS